MSAVIKRALPTALTRISASRHTDARSRVREWQTVTVAFRSNSMSATGLPTVLLRPTTTARLPSISTPVESISSIIPLGVQALLHSSFSTSLPTFSAEKPSTSLFVGICDNASRSSRCAGRGTWTRIPSTESSAAKASINSLSSDCGTEAGSAYFKDLTFVSSHALTLLRT